MMVLSTNYFRKTIYSLMVVGTIVTSFNACAGNATKLVTPPHIIPVDLTQAGEILNFTLRITDPALYDFSLRFSFKKNDGFVDRARVRLLTGSQEIDKQGRALNPGIPTPVRLIILMINGDEELVISTKDVDPILTSWGADSFGKTIDSVKLREGVYRVKLTLLQAAPAFENTPVFFETSYDRFKNTRE